MPRRIRVPSQFPFDLYTISSRKGVLEGSWGRVLETYVGPLLSRVPRRMVEEALRGHDAPLRRTLGLTPEGCLRKVPEPFCRERKTCVHWDKATCSVRVKKAPWCLVPDCENADDDLTQLLSEVIHQWRASVYVVVVEEEDYA